jgi:hypothetical protein
MAERGTEVTMRMRTALAAGTAIGLIALGTAALSQTPPPNPINPTVTCNTIPPNTPITSALLTSGLPCTATIIAPFTLDNIQHGFDYYSWLTFLALNSPSDGRTPIGKGPGKGGDAPTIWESWKELGDVMLPGGVKPPPWGRPGVVPAKCRDVGGRYSVVVRMAGKTPNVISAFNQPFKTGPLIDQRGYYARFEILMNRPMFEYIVANTLYSKQGQQNFAGAIDFPEGNVTATTPPSAPGTVGAIMVKAAWKVMGPGDDPAKFHKIDALVYTAPSENPKVEETCVRQTLGLVGLHIAHKTKTDPQWVWSTFEHVKNVPTQADVDAKKLQPPYHFYDAKCDPAKCPVNDTPPRPWDPNQQPFPGGFHSQITRIIPQTKEVLDMNAAFQGLLKGTVWANYMLISTQWPTNATSPTDPTGAPAPAFLANSTLETYIQGSVPQSSSNCIACHNNATTVHVPATPSDFTYILENAK